MACDDFMKDAERLLNGTLEPEAEEQLRRHMAECPDCAAVYEALCEDDRLLLDFTAEHTDAVTRLENTVIAALQTRQPAVPLWRRMMDNMAIRVAALFVITFGIAIIFNVFVSTPDIDFTGWDRVTARVQSASAVYWRSSIVDERGDRYEMRNWIAKEYGYRMDMEHRKNIVASSFYDPKTQELVTLIIPEKAYIVMPLDIQQIFGATDGMDIRELFGELLELEHEKLGTRRINGRLAVGIEVTDATFGAGEFDSATGRLWVDVENEWPVRMEIEAVAASGTIQNKIVMDDFKWDEVDASAFDVKVPPDFKLAFRADPVVNDEEHAIQGLRSYADLTGTYPSVLNPRTAMFEYRSGDTTTFGTNSDVKAMRIISTCVFFRTISCEKEDVQYYGSEVEPGDASRILLSWKEGEETYRVMYGDLSVATVDAAEFELLER